MTEDLTTLSEAELEALSGTALEELLAEPVATIGWFDLLGMGRRGATEAVVVISDRYSLIGSSIEKFNLTGTANTNKTLVGTSTEKFTITSA